MTVATGISPYSEACVFSRAIRRMGGWRSFSWLFGRALPATDRFVSRITGRNATLAGLLCDLEVLLLTTTGARTGVQRTTPVFCLREGDDFVVIASNWGKEHNPSWYYNLRANPKAKVTLGGSTQDVIAREVTGPRRDQCWQRACRMYPAYDLYKARAHRELPIMILSKAA